MLLSGDFAEIEALQVSGRWDEAGALLAGATAAAVKAAGLSTVGLLGTTFTMEQAFYRDRRAAHGLTVLIPEAEERGVVHSVIYGELCLGVISEASRAAYIAVIDRLVVAGAEGIVLGCTKIELLMTQFGRPDGLAVARSCPHLLAGRFGCRQLEMEDAA